MRVTVCELPHEPERLEETWSKLCAKGARALAAAPPGAERALGPRNPPGHGGAGSLLARTSPDQPCITVELDLARVRAAAATYPRYVFGASKPLARR